MIKAGVDTMKNEIANVELYSDLKNIIQQSRKITITNVNKIMLQTYWSIGKRIVEEEQNGNLKVENYEKILNCFLDDCVLFKSMLDGNLRGKIRK